MCSLRPFYFCLRETAARYKLVAAVVKVNFVRFDPTCFTRYKLVAAVNSFSFILYLTVLLYMFLGPPWLNLLQLRVTNQDENHVSCLPGLGPAY